jgi:L-ribulose-5-phosphate 4-epimerase
VLEGLRERVCRLNQELPRRALVTVTSGNVSGREPGAECVVIKPSGVPYDDLTADDMVVVSLAGEVMEGRLKPSVDTAAHLYLYRARPDVNGVVHTHSPYATAFAAAGRPIPVLLTAIADHFGGPIPLAPYAPVGGEDIGEQVMRFIGDSKAVLLQHHGIFTIGESPEAALNTAVLVEDVARTCFLALQLGASAEIPADEAKRAHKRYVDEYGQQG